MKKDFIVAYLTTLWAVFTTLAGPIVANYIVEKFKVTLVNYGGPNNVYMGYPVSYICLGIGLFILNAVLCVIMWQKALGFDNNSNNKPF